MKRLDLDLARRRAATAGWALLALACMLLLDAGASCLKLQEQIAQAEEQAGRPRGGAARQAAGHEAALRDAEAAARSLALPWDALFRSLEEATDAHVALLALQPDAGKRELRISGEARDYPAVLAFVERLDRCGTLRDVHLVKHERRDEDPQRPVAFRILASWEPRA